MCSSAAKALKTVHTFTATASAGGQTATASSTLTFWYIKGLGVVKHSKANTLAVADAVKAEIDRIRPTLP